MKNSSPDNNSLTVKIQLFLPKQQIYSSFIVHAQLYFSPTCV
uniref:Uncharacterized protein n=1 Tax=Anguilla anguilla TaxID=7936 RepID=A0A0E9U0S7_ANGAN